MSYLRCTSSRSKLLVQLATSNNREDGQPPTIKKAKEKILGDVQELKGEDKKAGDTGVQNLENDLNILNGSNPEVKEHFDNLGHNKENTEKTTDNVIEADVANFDEPMPETSQMADDVLKANVEDMESSLLDINNMEVIFDMVDQEFMPEVNEYHTNDDSNGKNEDENTTASNNDVNIVGLFEVNLDIISEEIYDDRVESQEPMIVQQDAPDIRGTYDENQILLPANEQDVEVIENKVGELSEDSEENSSLEDYKGRPKKGRKKKFKTGTIKGQKKRKDSNKTYYNYKGNKVYPKEFRDFHCTCKCNEKVTLDERKTIFNTFWDLADYDKQNLFISSLVSEKPVKRRRSAEEFKKRQFTREYSINNKVVCRSFFVHSLRLSTKRVNTALLKLRSQRTVTDQRGKCVHHNKCSNEKVEKVKDHINKIPKYKSHYCRAVTDSHFIPAEYTLTKLYELYKEETDDPVSQSKYNEIFYTHFNLKRKPLKKDTCSTCDSLKARLDSATNEEIKENLRKEHEEHLILVEKVREEFDKDFEYAKEEREKETLSFDLQKTLPLPRIPTNIVYYKRQIMMYNCGVHSGKTNKGHFYVWVEGTAGRGAQEIGSCLKKHIMENCPGIETLVLWSDSCGGQNRNIKITLMLKHILANHPTLKKITLKFMIPGHSFLPNDSEFGDVECHLKTQQRVYTDDDYVKIMETSRRRNAFIVKKMTTNDFLSTESLESDITNRKTNTNEEKINWFKFRQIEVRKEGVFSIFVKSNIEEPTWQEINILKKASRGRPYTSEAIFSRGLSLRWPNGKGISQPKMKDLKSMLSLIPNDAKPFYRNFFEDPSVCDDIDGFNADLDFEIDLNDA